VRARIDRHVAVLDCPAEDHPQRHEGVADRRWIASLGKEVIRDPLDVAVLNISQARWTETRDDVIAQCRRVAPDRARLVAVPRTSADATRRHASDELVGCLLDGRVRWRAQCASADTRLSL
jgi:hypothetical protein